MRDLLKNLNIETNHPGTSTGLVWKKNNKKNIVSFSPVDGKEIGQVSSTSESEYFDVINSARSAFLTWRVMPAPKRGEIVRQFGEEFGDRTYAFEELVAEITSAFFANYFALDGSLQHVDYIQHYVTALKSDTTIVKSAASKAQKAYEFLHDLQPSKLDVAV